MDQGLEVGTFLANIPWEGNLICFFFFFPPLLVASVASVAPGGFCGSWWLLVASAALGGSSMAHLSSIDQSISEAYCALDTP